jgi:hypothetical protein
MYSEQMFNVLDNAEVTIDVSEFAAGVYFIITETDGERSSQKLIVE